MTQPQSKEVALVDQVYQGIEHMQPKFAAALPPHVDSKKFTRVAITAIQNTPDLQTIARQSPAARNSIYNACSKAAADGLMPDGREGAIVAFNRNVGTKDAPRWEKHAQWMPMVEGLRKMVRNSGEISNISVQVVRENDNFDYQLGDREFIDHKPAKKNRGSIIGAYSIATLKDGEKSREYMDIDEIEAIRGRSKSKDSGPWKTDYSEMCRKTVFRRHYKSLPKSTDLDKVIEHDDDFVDQTPSSPAPVILATAKPAINPPYDPETGEVLDRPNEPQSQPRQRRTRAQMAAAGNMKQADVVEATVAKKPAFTRGDSVPVIEEEVNFEDEQQENYEEQEGDVV